jgi:uncharacterized protein YkwD
VDERVGENGGMHVWIGPAGLRRLVATSIVLALAVMWASCIEIEAPHVPVEGTVQAPQEDLDLAEIEREIEARINEIRIEHGLEPLEHNETLAAVARAYSCRMAREDFFAHESPDGDMVADRVVAADVRYRVVGENLAMIGGMGNPGEAAVEGWMESEGHRENLLRSNYEESGVGACTEGEAIYFTHVFLQPR